MGLDLTEFSFQIWWPYFSRSPTCSPGPHGPSFGSNPLTFLNCRQRSVSLFAFEFANLPVAGCYVFWFIGGYKHGGSNNSVSTLNLKRHSSTLVLANDR